MASISVTAAPAVCAVTGKLSTTATLRFAAIAAVLIAAKLAVYALLARTALPDALCHYDCGWYLGIAQRGYDTGTHDVGGFMQANWAFFPVYPLSVRLVGASPLAGLVVSGVGLWALLVLGARYRAVTRGEASPWSWLLLVLAWPYSFYFDIQYSESTYAALALACLLGLATARPWLAATGAALLTATRPTGILLAACVGLRQLWVLRRARTARAAVAILAPAAVAPLGLALFMVFLWWHVGDPLAFAHIQTAWNHAASSPLTVLLDAVRAANPHGGHPGLFYNVGWALVGLGLGVWLLARRLPAEAWLSATTVLMALSAGTIWSVPRFVAAGPVTLLAAADVFRWFRRPLLRAAIVLLFIVLQVVFLFAWFRDAKFLV